MATPLTDSINALTTYANEVTGASDTTLSDAVHTLASGYGGGDAFVIQSIASGLNGLFEVTNTIPYILPASVEIPTKIKIVAPYCRLITEMFYCQSTAFSQYPIEEIELDLPYTPVTCIDAFRRAVNLKKVIFTNGFIPRNPSYMFDSSWVETVIGEIDCTNVNNGRLFSNATKIKDITLKPNTWKSTEAIVFSSNVLTDASLVTIANVLSTASTVKTLTHASTAKARCSTLMGNNVDGLFVADENGAMSLADFITNVKGWTLT